MRTCRIWNRFGFTRANWLRPVSFMMAFALLVSAAATRAHGQYPPPPPQQQAPPPPPPPPGPDQGYPQGTAEPPQAPAPYLPPQQLDQLVQRIALYPDPLLAQTLTASTVWEQIPDAAGWADQHANLRGDQLAAAITTDNLQWDPSVMALLPFPQVLDMMAQDPGWTQQLGSAVLAQRGDVMDAVQRDRQEAYNYGYLRTNPYDTVVNNGEYVEILPVNPAYIYVPYYNPGLVFVAPRPGFAVGVGIRFGPAIVLGGAFAPWGWGTVGFGWGAHAILIDHTPWNRTWVNRRYYVHSYARPFVHGPGPRVEHHEVRREERR
ncbi:MAG: DUF3300 domain-containing protein [Terracidiphilus sp.]|jgi:hypothetical protein